VTARPKHTRKDANHGDVKWDLEMTGLSVWDTSDMPGGLDLLVSDGTLLLWVEVKPDRSAPFTPSEMQILGDNPHTTMVAYCAEDVLRRFGRCE